MLLRRLIGASLIIGGVVLIVSPEIVSSKPVPGDTFEAIERRIWWGLLPGFGILVLFLQQIKPWRKTLAITGCALLFGMLIARLIGIALDGSVTKQWVYVGGECLIMLFLLWWYRSTRHS